MKKAFQRVYRELLFLLLTVLFFGALEATALEDEDDSAYEDLRVRLERLERLESERLVPSWNKGLLFSNHDGSFSMKVGGMIHLDAGWLSSDRSLEAYANSHGDDFEDNVGFRRARIMLSGRLYDRYFYTGAYEFSNGDAEFKDLFIGADGLPLGAVFRVGHFKEPFSLDSLTNAGGLQFFERSLAQTLSPFRNTGAGLNGALLDDRVTWAAGVFYGADSIGEGGGDGDLSATARITLLPWVDGEDRLFHLGAAYSRRNEDDLRLTANPENKRSPDLLDTDGFPAIPLSPHAIAMNHADLLGAETACLAGPFSAQAEYIRMDVDGPGRTDPTFWGGYVSSGYFLTGEHRSYRRKTGAFESVAPDRDFLSGDGGIGAVELAGRVSFLDLDDPHVVAGGEMRDYTIGLNWYLNPVVRITLNYIHSHVERHGSGRFLLLRFALDF